MDIQHIVNSDHEQDYLEIKKSGIWQVITGTILILAGIVFIFMIEKSILSILLGIIISISGGVVIWFAKTSIITLKSEGVSTHITKQMLTNRMIFSEEFNASAADFVFYHIQQRIQSKTQKRK